MTTFVQVAVNVPLSGSGIYDYHLPEELEGRVKPGCLVIVPFGKRTVQGLALRLTGESAVPETRPVQTLVDDQPALTAEQMKLAQWMADETLSPLAACIELMLPPGLSQHTGTLYGLNSEKLPAAAVFTPLQNRLIDLLRQRGPLRDGQIDNALPKVRWREAAEPLLHKEILGSQPFLLPPTVQPKRARTVWLTAAPETLAERLEGVARPGSAALERRKAALRFLQGEALPVDVAWVKASSGATLADLQSLAEKDLVAFGETEVWRDPLEHMAPVVQQAPQLTGGQMEALERVRAGLRQMDPSNPPAPYLLHGVTGSGKTEIYLQAVAEALRQGRQAIILVPEISLTPQTVKRFLGRFPGQVGLVHSRLSPGERYDTWRRARSGQLSVIVGPRSALFTPLPRLGLIVVDECHDDSYYQDDQTPVYHAVQAALAYARITGSVVLLGSATPEIGLYYRAQREHWNLLELPERILAHRQILATQASQSGISMPELDNEGEAAFLPLPPVQVVDMRQELKAGNRSIFSRSLQDSLTQVLNAGQQAILFLNRRGSSTYVFCRECGHVLRCPRCDMPLTFHSDTNDLRCHICNYQRQMPAYCPQCRSTSIRQYGTGTERVESEVQKTFPNARTLRWDAETTRQKGSHEILLSHFSHHQADILIGTQMLAKGLDLPLVTLVGVVLADVGLNLPDYRTPERTFQLLTQVAGRAGRSPLGGRVILQTYRPDHYAIQFAAKHDYSGFLQHELAERRKIGYPPFSRLVRLELRQRDPASAEAEAHRMAEQLQVWMDQEGFTSTRIIGPAPCFFARQNGLYRWQILLRGPEPARLLRGKTLGEWRVAVDPTSLL
ncbi:replication restart DNA helicase PriA [Longilinea arvoryzae]|uniref:Replication restart protein PriA n=1 Tax=Longilinea arvoryzae TaxID=360412 RepID=A0A0S7BHQ5_9CHLR|nr:primosomal protein N' [Longilinea arvoryzae]GAP14022.1 replication restart DNA helicase PriA [Longilinea arvoryzae]